METTTIILVLLLAVVASSMIERASPAPAPAPFIQIALGALIAASFDFSVEVDPKLFLLLFIAPLLFLDGWRIPREGLFRDKWTAPSPSASCCSRCWAPGCSSTG
ncbi:cation:proton antiporter [Methylocella sp.]|uniref:cation:proton antiporter domain-containing protein n=1 Tax=Methylocella sp. TaxID=1978226 RepID=UPI003785018F